MARTLSLALSALALSACERLGFPPPFTVDEPTLEAPTDARSLALSTEPPPELLPAQPRAATIEPRRAQESVRLFAQGRVTSVRAVNAPGFSVNPDFIDARTHVILGRTEGRRSVSTLYDLATNRTVGRFYGIDWSSDDNRVHTLATGNREGRSHSVLTVADQRAHTPRPRHADGTALTLEFTALEKSDGTVYVVASKPNGERFIGPWNPLEGDDVTLRTAIPFRPRTYSHGGPERATVLEAWSWLDGFHARLGRECVGLRVERDGAARCMAWGDSRPEWTGWNDAVLLGDYAYTDHTLPVITHTLTGRDERGPMTEGHCQTVKQLRSPPRAVIACAGVGAQRNSTDWYWWAPGEWRVFREPSERFYRIGDGSQVRARLMEMQSSSNGPISRWIDLIDGTLVDHAPLQEVMFQSSEERWAIMQRREPDGSLSLFLIDSVSAQLKLIARRTDCPAPAQIAVEAQGAHRIAIGCFAARAPGLFSFIVRWSAEVDIERETITTVPGQVVALLSNGETLVGQQSGRWVGESDYVARELRRVSTR